MDFSSKGLLKARFFQLLKLVLLLLLPFSSFAESNWRGEISYQKVDNVSNAQLRDDTFEDSHWDLAIGYGYFADFDDGLSLTTSVDLESFDYQDWPGFSHHDLSAGLNLRKKLGLGSYVPSIGASMTVSQNKFDQDVRDQNQYTLSFYWAKRISESTDIKLDLGYFRSSADNNIAAGPSGTDTGMAPSPMNGMSRPGDTFDQARNSLGAEIGYSTSDDWFLVSSIRYIDGDLDSTAQPNAGIIDASSAIVADPAIGDGYFAYRVDAESWLFDVQWEYSFSDTWGVLINYQYIDAEAKDWPVDYKVTRFGFNLIAAF